MIGAILTSTSLALIAFGLGKRILSFFNLSFDDLWENIVFSTGLGLGIISLVILILGLLKLLYPIVLLALIIPAAIIALFEVIKIRPRIDRFDLVFLLLLGIVIISCAVPAYKLPLVFDELTYHLALPAKYLSSHSVTSIPYNLYSNFPLNLEMLYVVGLAFGGPFTCRLIYIMVLAFCGISIYALAKKHFNPRTALFSAIVFFSIPNVLFNSIMAYNDLGLVFFVILSIFALLNWEKPCTRRTSASVQGWLILSGIFCGLALGVKYTGIINLILIASYILVKKRSLRSLIFFVLSALLTFSPWMVKNLFFVGNPVYPFLYTILGGKYWNSFNDQRYFAVLKSYGPQKLINLPWHLFGGISLDRPLGPVFFLVLPFIVFIRKVDRKIKYFLLYSGIYFIVWVLSARVIRFYLPPAALLCICCGYIVNRYRTFNKIVYIILSAGLTFFFAGSLWFFCTTAPLGIPHVQKELNGYFESANYIKENLPADAKVLFIGEPRGFGFGPNTLTSTMFDKSIIVETIRSSATPREIRDKLKQKGVSHLLINYEMLPWLDRSFNYFNWDNKSQQKLYKDFMKSRFSRTVKKFNGITIYEIE